MSFCNRPSSSFDCTISGCTGTVIVVRENKVLAGHVGDSRSVLGKKKNGAIIAKELTRDHKPTLDDEKARIERMGGEVKKLEGDIPYRVFIKDKSYPGIAMSRSLGDALAQTVGVSCMPEVNQFNIEEDDQFIVVCSDGVWEFISSQEAVEEVAKYSNVKDGAEALAKLAWDRWILNEVDVVDDITVIVAYLNQITH